MGSTNLQLKVALSSLDKSDPGLGRKLPKRTPERSFTPHMHVIIGGDVDQNAARGADRAIPKLGNLRLDTMES